MKGAEKKPTKVGWELYDFQRDPYELNNVYAHAAYRLILQGLKTQLKNLKEELGDTDEKYPELLELVKKNSQSQAPRQLPVLR
jgi:N-acetylglucosamine-6-sulfatase